METDRRDALELAKGLPATASNIERVSKTTSPEAARWAFTQWELRKKAAAKGFPKAEEMLFTREALEQATHFAVARYHASLFPAGELVADLTSGIGSDLIALAQRGPVIGFDTDAERLEYARHNLGVHRLAATLVLGNCLDAGWDFEYAIADPSRRIDGRRTLSPDELSPNPSLLARRMSELQIGFIKLSPMMSDEYFSSLGPKVEFVSFGRECREALVFCGRRVRRGRLAVKAETGDRVEAGEPMSQVDEPLKFFYEADPAAIRGHALGTLGLQLGASALGDSHGYLTSNELFDSPWMTAFRVMEFGHLDVKTLRARLSAFGGGTPIVKVRSQVDLTGLANELKTKGEGAPIVAVYAVGESLRYAILDRVIEDRPRQIGLRLGS